MTEEQAQQKGGEDARSFLKDGNTPRDVFTVFGSLDAWAKEDSHAAYLEEPKAYLNGARDVFVAACANDGRARRLFLPSTGRVHRYGE